MSGAEPIKNKKVNDLANAPTPQNTPATAASSFAGRASHQEPSVSTIEEEPSAGAGGDSSSSGAAGLAGAAGALNLANNPALLSMIQGKLGTLVGKPSGYIDSLPQAVKDRIAGLKGVQAEHSKLEAQFQEELLELEKRFFKKYEPLYQRRAKIISGDEEPTADEITTGKELNEELEKSEEDNNSEEKSEENGIPEFWLTALRNLVPVAETISDRDEEALGYLKDIRMNYLEKPGFALVFEFSENPYFENKTLTKTYYYQEETGYGGDFIYDHAEGDDIKWKSQENNLTVRVEKRKQRNKHTKATRTIEKTIPTESFFQFFNPPKAPHMNEDGEQVDEDGEEEEIPEDLEERLEMDYQLGEEIKEKLIPRAVDWYTGEALEYEDLNEFDEDEYDDEEGLSEHDDEDGDDDDDDDTDEEGGENNGDKQGECKQQ